MAEDLVNDKWVEIQFSVSAVAHGLIKLKKEMESFAEQLDWVVEVDKKGYVGSEGARWYEVKVMPKGGKTSPEEIRQKRDLIIGFASAIYLDILNREDAMITTHSMGKRNDTNELLFLIDVGGILRINADLKRAIKLEKIDHNLENTAFMNSDVRKFYDLSKKNSNKFLSNKSDKEAWAANVRQIEQCGFIA